MDLNDYEIEDFLTDESFIKYCLRSDDPDVDFWEAWINTNPVNKDNFNQAVTLFTVLNGGRSPSQLDADNNSFEIRLRDHVRPTQGGPAPSLYRKRRRLFFLGAAAAVLFIISSAALFVYFQRNVNTTGLAKNSRTLSPGRNTATLTLANGRKIVLSEASVGKLAEESGASVTKTADGRIEYQSDRGSGNETQFNILSTARGEQYQVILPDSTKVWINAVSSIRYPTTFKNLNERRVELSGEAYFEVAKDKKHPFVVSTVSQELRVLGTHFNVNAYADEEFTKTTLLEGMVSLHALTEKVQSTIIIKPGQQARLQSHGFKVFTVDTEEATAWKDGYFRFENERLESIMRKVSRWYDATIVFEAPDLRSLAYSGFANRYANVSELLATLEATKQASFKVSGKTIIVMHYTKTIQ